MDRNELIVCCACYQTKGGGNDLWKKSVEKLDILIKLTADNNALLSSMSPNKSATQSSGLPSGLSSLRRSRSQRTPSSGTMHPPDPSSSSSHKTTSPSTRLDFDDTVSSFLQTHFQSLPSSSSYKQVTDIQEMQLLYDDLVRQLRQLFDEKAALVELNADLQRRLVDQTELYQSRHDDMRADFDTKLRAARQLAEEARDQQSANKAAEKRLFEKERDLHVRMSTLDEKYLGSEAELASLRLQLQQCERRVASLQEELVAADSARRESENSLEDFSRKHKELSRSLSAKEEQLTALHRECLDLHAKLKKPFIVPARLIDSAEKRITHDHELNRLRDELQIIRESERDLQQQYLRVQAESLKEVRALKEAAARELHDAVALSEKKADGLRKEVFALRKQVEEHQRFQLIAEQQLSSVSMQAIRMEQDVEKMSSENVELSFSKESNEVEIGIFQEKLRSHQDELSRAARDLKRARESIDEFRRVNVEKDRVVSGLKQRYQHLQLSMKAHLEKDIELLTAITVLVAHNSTHSLSLSSLGFSPPHASASPVADISMSSSSIAGTPGSISFSTPIKTPVARDAETNEGTQHSTGASSKSKSLRLSELESQCASQWTELFAAVDKSVQDLRGYYSKTGQLRSELDSVRDNHALVKTELELQVARQRQEMKEMKRRVEELEGHVRRLEGVDAVSQKSIAELSDALTAAREELSSKAAQIKELQSSIAAANSQLSAAQSTKSAVSEALRKAEFERDISRQELESSSKKLRLENSSLADELQSAHSARNDLKSKVEALKAQLHAARQELELKSDNWNSLSMDSRSRLQELQSVSRQELEATQIEFQVTSKKLDTSQRLLEDTLRQLQQSKQELITAVHERDCLEKELQLSEKQNSSFAQELDAARLEGSMVSKQLQQVRLELVTVRSERVDIERQLLIKQEESVVLARELEAVRDEGKSFSDELQQVRQQLVAAQGAKDDTSRRLELQLHQVMELRQGLEAAHQEAAVATSGLEDARREIHSTAKELDAARQELSSVKNQLVAAKEQCIAVSREKASSHEQYSQAEKAHLQVITAIKLDIESLPQVVDSKSGGVKALPPSAVPLSKGSDATGEDKVYQLLMDTAAQLKAKNRDLHKFFKARKNADTKHSDSLLEWLDAMNAYSAKGLLSSAVGIIASRVGNYKHLHNNIVMSAENTELMSKITAFEDNLSQLMQRAKAKNDDMKALEVKLLASRAQVERLENRASNLEPTVVETRAQLSECQQRVELLALQEEALIRNRDRLENDLSVLDDKYRASMMHQDELEHSLSVAEDDLTSTKQELIDARIAIDEIYLDLQSCRNELSTSLQAHAAVTAEKESLEGDLFTVRRERDSFYEELKKMKEVEQMQDLQITTYQSNWSDLERSYTQLQKERVDLGEQLADVQRERSELGGRTSELQRDNTELTLKLYKSQSSLKEALSDAAEMKTQLSLKDKSLSSLEDRIAALQTEVHERSIEVTSLQPLVAELRSSQDEVRGLRDAQADLERRYQQCVVQLDQYQLSTEQLSKSQSESDQRNVDLQSRLLKLDNEHSDLLARSTSLEQQLASYVHLDSDYKTVSHNLTAKVAEAQLLRDQLDVEKQSSLQLRSSLDVMSLQNKQYEEQQTFLHKRLEALTEEHSKRAEKQDLLTAEQAAQQQQSMEALRLQLQDIQIKNEFSDTALRLLDEQLRNKVAELSSAETSLSDLVREKAAAEQQILLLGNDNQHLEASLKEWQAKCDAKEESLRHALNRVDTVNALVEQQRLELSALQEKLSAQEGSIEQLQRRRNEIEEDLSDKERLLEEVSGTARDLMHQLQKSERALIAAMTQARSLQDECSSKQSIVAAQEESLQSLKDDFKALELLCRSQGVTIDEGKQSAANAHESIVRLEVKLASVEQKHQEVESALVEAKALCLEQQSTITTKDDELQRLHQQCNRLELTLQETEDTLKVSETIASKLRIENGSSHALQLELTRNLEEVKLAVLALERELAAAKDSSAAKESALTSYQLQCDSLKATLAEKERCLEDASLSVYELTQKAQQLVKQEELQSTSLLIHQTNQHRLEAELSAARTELSRTMQLLSESEGSAREQGLVLAETTHKESVARMQWQLLEKDRDDLFTKLQETSSALASTRIELAEATSRLQTRAAIESELITEKQSQQLKLEEALKECNYLRSTSYEETHVIAKQRGSIRELRDANEELVEQVVSLKGEREQLERELKACRADLLVREDNQVYADQLKTTKQRLHRAESDAEVLQKRLESCQLQCEVLQKEKEFVSRQLQSSMDQVSNSLHSDALHSKGEMNRLAMDLDSSLQDLNKLNLSLREASAHNDALREKNAALSSRLASKLEECESMSQELSRLKDSSAMGAQDRLLEVQALRDQLDRSTAKINSQKIELDDLQAQLKPTSSMSLSRELSDVKAQLMAATTQEQQKRAQFELLQHEHKIAQREMADVRAENERLNHRLKNAQMDMDYAQRQFALNNSMYSHTHSHPRPVYDSSPVMPSNDRLSNAIESIGSILRDKGASTAAQTVGSPLSYATQQKEVELVHQKYLDLLRERDALESKSKRQERKIDKLRSKLELREYQDSSEDKQAQVSVLSMEIDKYVAELRLKDNELQLKEVALQSTQEQLQQLQTKATHDMNASQERQFKLELDLRRSQQDTEDARHALVTANRTSESAMISARKDFDIAMKESNAQLEASLEDCQQLKRNSDLLKREVAELGEKLSQSRAEVQRAGEVERALLLDNDRLKASVLSHQSNLSALTEECNQKFLEHSSSLRGLMERLDASTQHSSQLQLQLQELRSKLNAMVDRFMVSAMLADDHLHRKDPSSQQHHQQLSSGGDSDLLLEKLSEVFRALEAQQHTHRSLQMEYSEAQQKLVFIEGKNSSLVSSSSKLEADITDLVIDNNSLKRELGSVKDLLKSQQNDFKDKEMMKDSEFKNKLSLKEAEHKEQLAAAMSRYSVERDRMVAELSELRTSNEELSASLASMKSSNEELEYMCDTMVSELKQSMAQDADLQAVKEDYQREIAQLNEKAKAELESMVGPMRTRIDELTTRLQVDCTYEATVNQQLLQIHELVKSEKQLKLELSILQDTIAAMPTQKALDDSQRAHDRSALELSSIHDHISAVYDKMMLAYSNSPQKIEGGSLSSPALVGSSSSPSEKLSLLERSFKECLTANYELHINCGCQQDVVKVKNELISDLKHRLQQLTLTSESNLHAIADDLTKLSASLHVPKSSSYADSSFPPPPIQQQVTQAIERLGQDFDRAISKHKTEYNRLNNECFSLRREVESLTDQLQFEKRNDGMKAQLSETLDLNRRLQESLSKGQVDIEHREQVVQQLVEQTTSVQQSWQSMEREYQTKIGELRDQLKALKTYRDETQLKIREFDQLLGTAFYNSPTVAPLSAESSSPAAARGGGGRSSSSRKSPALRTPPSDRSLKRTHPSGTLGELLQDVHRVLKDHRRLKRLCSSQQLCILSLRYVQ